MRTTRSPHCCRNRLLPPEILLFGSLAFAIATWLALTSRPQQPVSWKRSLIYFGWGLVIGLGLFSHLVIAPTILMAGILLVLGCWREWRTWALPCVLLGILLGAFPLIWYNLHATPGQDSLSIFETIHLTDQSYHLPLINQVKGTFLISLPLITGIASTCHVSTGVHIGFANPHPLRCMVEYTSWSIGFISLCVVASF